jgi:sterol desaturase/sphingolipid hydroxylase (fatty acid hydroxylase superfamily)
MTTLAAALGFVGGAVVAVAAIYLWVVIALVKIDWLRIFRLTEREYFADFFITPPITLVLAIVSFRGDFVPWLMMLAAGVIGWTLYEYAIHRASHHAWLLREIHHLHHSNQREYVAVHPLVTLALYAIFWLTFGIQSTAFAIGFSVGYILYSVAHTLFHYTRIALPLKRHHALHHKFGDVNFGVTTTAWDRLLGTYRG